ncbi:concanavalin A-like lectin/glucanase [Aureobasidium pullulans]|nr:concanavalin A-like lectin/glucanase [Aureobasidium pullulans]THW36207.1 concanavalin A-like lectin/glucanase [Aureobasidium pullulans]THX69303.1 concanavalin A-like lectin/glucanase [Aureobasidium pullulans]THY48046.1 concanavalin A-like lectin/glucanase [Aureobasidium pullulans]THY85525.1 concanavalin A-like lectin/glucanase [Aureobasidium pullulans]
MAGFMKTAAFVLAATAVSKVSAQTFSDCNPMFNTTCTPNTALGTWHDWNFTDSTIADTKIWNTTGGTPDYTDVGAQFTIGGKGDSPTLESNFYIFFGQVSVIMKAAPGVGIVSSVVLESDDLDEIDWEWLGGNNTSVETNYFGKGNTTSYDRAIYYDVDDVTGTLHNYSITWTQEKLEWLVDDKVLRTLKYEDALNGENYPQTPMKLKIGIWAGGDPDSNSNGTVEWAGGVVDYHKTPFTMTMERVYVADFSTGSTYTYGDQTGSYESIKIAEGNSTIAQRLAKPHGAEAHYKALPKWAQATIAAGSIAVFAIALVAFVFCCIKSRRAGRRERAAADALWEKEMQELAEYKRNSPHVGSGGAHGVKEYF